MLDPESQEIGRLAGAQEAMVRLLESVDRKLDDAARDREKLIIEMRTLKHDQGNINMKVDAVVLKMVQMEEDTDRKFLHIEEGLTTVTNWQQRMVGRVSAFGILGAIIGWMIINVAAPLVIWVIHGGQK